jgi:hypothetical protein
VFSPLVVRLHELSWGIECAAAHRIEKSRSAKRKLNAVLSSHELSFLKLATPAPTATASMPRRIRMCISVILTLPFMTCRCPSSDRRERNSRRKKDL